MSLRRFMAACLFIAGCGAGVVQASVVIGSTRVIYPASEKEVTVSLANRNTQPVLVQAWVDTGDALATPDTIKIPFIVHPPMFRMEPDRGHAVRLTYTGDPLPDNRETMYWFNALEVPPRQVGAAGTNHVQFALRTRIKLIFRPSGLPGNAAEAFKQLGWKWTTGAGGKGVALAVTNPSAYYVNFADVGLKVDGVRKLVGNGGMVAPGGTTTFSLDPLKLADRPSGDVKVSFDVIDDSGASSEQEAALVPRPAACSVHQPDCLHSAQRSNP
ncbi:molecular chaperone [Ralstonia soli]|uniref:Molecular chaperone n=1 Tax=Ralstonia soli TaxID=2953896 RepID=A0ABT1AGQ1_9RALS|nr:molecular chaperone [Ralstonia soli]MCO5397574.1 molecular chaperone [Ralstonia soli]